MHNTHFAYFEFIDSFLIVVAFIFSIKYQFIIS